MAKGLKKGWLRSDKGVIRDEGGIHLGEEGIGRPCELELRRDLVFVQYAQRKDAKEQCEVVTRELPDAMLQGWNARKIEIEVH